MGKEAVNPKDPYSKEHWEASIGVVATLFGAKGLQSGIEDGMINGQESQIAKGDVADGGSKAETFSFNSPASRHS